MKNKFLFLILIFSVIFLYHSKSSAYSIDVHRKITEKVIKLNEEKISKYISSATGLSDGIRATINNKTIKIWIEDGSYYEDFNWNLLNNPLFSHFYNPLTNKSGVGDIWFSAYDWSNSLVNPWSWRIARNKFYEGLTLKTKTEREKALADAFRAIGHVIHLVEDVAVPAHTRGDLHISEPYEKYTNKNIGSLSYTSVPFQYWKISISPTSPKQFWDLDSYNGSIPYGSGYIGLAEYTNANFASSDTIFSETLFSFDPHYFPFPRKSSSILYEEINPLTNKKTKYFRIIKDSENIEHFAVAGRFYDIFEGWPNLRRSFISLDDKCHDEYQQKLIPRAVGYSAGLLNYFFRGSIDMVRDTENDACKYVVYNFSNENMEGTFGLYYDDASGNRNNVASGDLTANAGKPSNPITLNLTDEEKKKSKYILVFQGKMGNETNAVVADTNVTPFISSCGKELTITGSDTVSQDSSEQFEVTGCTGCEDDVKWEITGEGATIDKTGVLLVDKTACGGTLTLTAKCPVCETELTKTITIPDAITISAPDSSNCYTASGGAEPYQWDITKGTIDEKGCADIKGQCGTVTINVTDANKCTGKKNLDIPTEELIITGSDTTTRNSTRQYTATGCGEVQWSVSGKGASINKTTGLLTTDSTACGAVSVTATCTACNTTATKSVRVTDAGQWVYVPFSQKFGCSTNSQCYCGRDVWSSKTEGQYRYRQIWSSTWGQLVWYENCQMTSACLSPKTPDPGMPICGELAQGRFLVNYGISQEDVYSWECPR
ncbi:MAG: hypothetical protein EPN94_09545 [Nitrospirae bacterium]|nr:MAG: hypothetical protein EPN94_09545 [Nitrospirota bacterium]